MKSNKRTNVEKFSVQQVITAELFEIAAFDKHFHIQYCTLNFFPLHVFVCLHTWAEAAFARGGTFGLIWTQVLVLTGKLIVNLLCITVISLAAAVTMSVVSLQQIKPQGQRDPGASMCTHTNRAEGLFFLHTLTKNTRSYLLTPPLFTPSLTHSHSLPSLLGFSPHGRFLVGRKSSISSGAFPAFLF